MSTSSLFDGYNAGYAQELLEEYARNPASVPLAWREIFADRLQELLAEGLLPPDAPPRNGGGPEGESGTEPSSTRNDALLPLIARAAFLIQAFRDHGHQLARIDPLGSDPPGHPQLDPSFFGTSLQDLEEIPTSLVMDGGGDAPLSETLFQLRTIYCGSIGYQFEHLEDPEKVRWLWNEVESGRHTAPISEAARIQLLERLSQVEGFETFLHRAYLGQKRFSIEGTDMLVPMLDLALECAVLGGGERVVLGMAHRGRLNVLTHILGMDYEVILREFESAPQENEAHSLKIAGTGDVKYHFGASGHYVLPDGKGEIEVVLAPNPSHLEFVNPVVMGMVRALQFSGPEQDAPRDPSSVVPILIHGDAAFAAEGVVAESLNLARLKGYEVGGTIHLIANNQIGFTTAPADGRSTRYASDLARGYDIPVLHVNADDPEACLAAVRLAMEYRRTFRDDFVIDLIGYRRFGHNEGDEPAYTQPLLYAKIAEHPTVRTLWADRLVGAGSLTREEVTALGERVSAGLRQTQERIQEEVRGHGDTPLPPRHGSEEEEDSPTTSSSLETLSEINRQLLEVPTGFNVHPKLSRQLDRRRETLGPATKLDWGQAEGLALGLLLQDGVPIRLTGQDTERGTFSHRHLVLHDALTGAETTPITSIGDTRFEVYNSPLSEVAALGFEYGYSVAAAEDFVLWEAQFGDFVNVAQVTIDQFIASGRAKWGQLSRLTLLLPHGYEGQGPEHSSARLERFLQLCAENNMRVASPSTPAQYFHLLRRQALGKPIRPLIVMTPKSLLRHPQASSPAVELMEGTFQPVVRDPHEGDPGAVRRLLFCTGKVYYDLAGADGRANRPELSIARIEELYPFPAEAVSELLSHYPGLQEVVWVQEEPRNMGALSYIGPLLRGVVPRAIHLKHVARPERASPAEGRNRNHRVAQDKIILEALEGP